MSAPFLFSPSFPPLPLPSSPPPARHPSVPQLLRAQPEAYVLKVPPLNPSSLIMGNPGEAMRIIFLTDHRMVHHASEPELIDSGVIFAQRFIRQRFPTAARKSLFALSPRPPLPPPSRPLCPPARVHVTARLSLLPSRPHAPRPPPTPSLRKCTCE